MQYNQYGSPTQTTDARGTQTLLTYGNVGGSPIFIQPNRDRLWNINRAH